MKTKHTYFNRKTLFIKMQTLFTIVAGSVQRICELKKISRLGESLTSSFESLPSNDV